jgi:hypothetical protein
MGAFAKTICRYAALVALAAAASPVDRAAAASTDIGAVADIQAAEAPSPISGGGFAVQVSEAAGTYAVPAGYDTITAWRHSVGTTAGVLTFKILRPTGAPKEFIAVASDTRSVAAGSVQSFAVQIPVQPGDRIGLSSDDVELAYETFSPFDRIGFFSVDVPTGGTRTTDGDPFQAFKLDVAATLTSAPGAEPEPAPAAVAAAPYVLPGRAPVLQRLALAPNAFAAARRGTSMRSARVRGSGAKVTYRADIAATVRFTVQRARPGRRARVGAATRCVAQTQRNLKATRCTRYVSVAGAFMQTARAGTNSFYFTGRIGGRTLATGSYRLVATPTAGGLAGRPVSTRLRIVRRR